MHRTLVIALVCVSFAGCAAREAQRPKHRTVMDVTWGEGWEEKLRAAYKGSDDAMDTSYRYESGKKTGPDVEYYREHVRSEDEEGKAVPLVEQIVFQDVAPNVESGEPPVEGEVEFLDSEGKAFRLSSLRGKPLVLVFTRGFPGYVCAMCTTYTAQVAAATPRLREMGAEVRVVFPGDRSRAAEFQAACRAVLEEEGPGALPFPVLLDPDLAAVDEFGIRADLSRPATYVLDSEGLVRYAYVGTLPHERPNMERIIAEVAKLTGGAR